MSWKKVFVGFLIGLFTYGCCTTIQTDAVRVDPVVSTRNFLDSVTKLRMGYTDTPFAWVAAGFAVNKKDIVTAGHYCNNILKGVDKGDLDGNLELIVVNRNGEVVILDGAEIIAFDDESDLCVVRREKHGLVPLGIMEKFRQNVKIGDEVITIGSPLGYFPVETKGKIVSLKREHKPLTSVISTQVAPGNSGGPVINEDGLVVGIVSAVNLLYDRITIMVPANVLRKFLRENKIKH
jgi:S1-C subfamily serine protease